MRPSALEPSKVLLVAALIACGTSLDAQAVVRGAVTSEQGQRVAGVELLVSSLNVTARTDATGEFKLVLPPGNYKVTARAIGFLSISDSIQPERDVELIHDFTLTPIATVLDVVTSTAPPGHFSTGLRGFDQRRQTGHGQYLTEKQLRDYGNRLLGDVLRRLPGVVIRPGKLNGNFAASTRGASRTRGACFVSVYLDGQPLFTGIRGETPPDLNLFSSGTLAGAEFYQAYADSPPQFKDRTGCGLLLLWTREQ